MSLEKDDQDRHAPKPEGGDSSLPKKLGVLVNLPLEADYIKAIEGMDARVRVLCVFEPRSEDEGARDGKETSAWREVTGDELDVLLAQAEVYVGFRFPMEWLERAPSLKWVQLASAGSDHMLRAGLLERRPNLKLTTASGVHEVPISEHIAAMILHFSRGFNVAVRNQPLHKWERYRPTEANEATVCLLGYGPIGKRAARLCKGLGMKVTVVRASLEEQTPGDEVVESFYPVRQLNDALAGADYVVVAAPRTARSEKMVGKEQFEVMKQEAVLINISRGALVDEAALVEVLREGKIRGAGLDVFEEEPLPGDSPLWDMPNVLITPHNAGANPHYNRRVTELFCDNLGLYLAGKPLRNVVEVERGY
jgi:phosphoglycerate dehydrogenase-like enzyme